MSAGSSTLTASQLNALQRQAVLAQAVPMVNQISAQTINPAQNGLITLQPRNVGLLTKFVINVLLTIANNDTANALTLTDFGLANVFSNLTFTDLNNNQRINTTGWHLSFLNSIKYRQPFASGYLLETDAMGGYGENYGILSSPATIAAAPAAGTPTVATVRASFELPITYSDEDLRGAIYMNVLNAQAQLQLQLNPTPFTATGVNSTGAIYKGTSNATITSATVTVYQHYLDQLPVGSNGVVLPVMDVSTIYELKMSPFQSIAQNQDFPVAYANMRDFLSTIAVYNHDTTTDTGRVGGTDINYWALQSANFTNLWKMDPLTQSMRTRQILGCDLPKGAYYMNSRNRPISTLQYGNMELVVNPTVANSNSQLLIGWEDFSLVNTLSTAGSLASS